MYRKDWGALILIDERYSKGHHYTKGVLEVCVCIDNDGFDYLNNLVFQSTIVYTNKCPGSIQVYQSG